MLAAGRCERTLDFGRDHPRFEHGFIDGTVVNVALPALQSALQATLPDVQWVVESYAIVPGSAAASWRRSRGPVRAAQGFRCWCCALFRCLHLVRSLARYSMVDCCQRRTGGWWSVARTR
jgi:hypothetical protein